MHIYMMKHFLNITRAWNAQFLYRNVGEKMCSVCENRHASMFKNVPVIVELTGCTQKAASDILRKNNTFAKIDEERIRKAAAVIKKLGFKKEDLSCCIEILSKHPLTIESHFKVLEEGGFIREQLSPVGIYRYLTFVRRKIKVLKLYGLIASTDDVTQNFCSYAMMPKSLYPASCDDDMVFLDAQIQVMEAFLSWRLSLSKTEMIKLSKVYSVLRHRSVRQTKYNLDILEKDIGFTKVKICKHAYLLFTDADNIVSILKKVPKLGGTDLLAAIHTFPKILATPIDAILKIQQHLNEFSVPDIAVSRALNIFTLSPESVYQRLKYMYSVPQFTALLHHPLTLRLVLHQRKAAQRLELLSKMKIKCASLHVLSTGDSIFNKYAEKGEDRTRGDDLTRFIGSELKVDRKEIRTKLQRHPYWYHVPVITVKENFEYLRKKKFSVEDIFKSVQILLYPKESIMEELNALERRPGIEYCKADGKITVRRETVLPLVMYFIEQQHNFSGEGIWLQHELQESKSSTRK